MYIRVYTSEVKDTKDEEPAVTDIEVIKLPGYFNFFEYGKEFLNNLDLTHEHE